MRRGNNIMIVFTKLKLTIVDGIVSVFNLSTSTSKISIPEEST